MEATAKFDYEWVNRLPEHRAKLAVQKTAKKIEADAAALKAKYDALTQRKLDLDECISATWSRDEIATASGYSI